MAISSKYKMRGNSSLEDCWAKYLDWFHHNCHLETTWFGRLTQKTPFDAWIYQEIIYETKPTVIIEIGNYDGGSTLFLANILDSLGQGKILGIDIDHSSVGDISNDRIEWITGDATTELIYENVRKKISKNDKVMIIEDSSHKYTETLKILELYSNLVSKNCYFIVEDSISKEKFVDGPKPGPYQAIHEFLKNHPEFKIDKSREKFFFTYNEDGYLKKIDNDKLNTQNSEQTDNNSSIITHSKRNKNPNQLIQEKNELLVKAKIELHKSNFLVQEKDKLLEDRHKMIVEKDKQLDKLQKELHKINMMVQEKDKLLEDRHKMIVEKNKQLDMISKELEQIKTKTNAFNDQTNKSAD